MVWEVVIGWKWFGKWWSVGNGLGSGWSVRKWFWELEVSWTRAQTMFSGFSQICKLLMAIGVGIGVVFGGKVVGYYGGFCCSLVALDGILWWAKIGSVLGVKMQE